MYQGVFLSYSNKILQELKRKKQTFAQSLPLCCHSKNQRTYDISDINLLAFLVTISPTVFSFVNNCFHLNIHLIYWLLLLLLFE